MIRRLLFYLFGLADVILVARFAPKMLAQLASVSHEPLPGALLDILRLVFIVSVLVSAVGLFGMKRWALILSYIQFPFRFVFMLLSFGFITLLARELDMPGLYRPLIYTAMILECARLILSVWIHRTPNKSPEPTAVGACSSAIAVHATGRRWLSFLR
jgi:hypothetical protein